MLLEKIWLQNFRNHESLVVEFLPVQAGDSRVTLVVGANGSGKSNLLEAIYLLATGRNYRAEKTEEMVGWGKPLGRVKGLVSQDIKDQKSNSKNDIELEVVVTGGTVYGQMAPLKRLMVNGVRRQLRNFVSNLRVVMFGPGDMRLIEGSPSRRRGFLDDVLSQVFPEYRRSWLSYEKGVRRRNKVLWEIREGRAGQTQLFFWDKLLVKEGRVISEYRRRLIEFFNTPLLDKVEGPISRGEFTLREFSSFRVFYDESAISEERLAKYAREEVAAAVTLVGPHRDDFNVQIQSPRQSNGQAKFKIKSYVNGQLLNVNCVDLATYGSRGQQRMAVLWLKLGSLAFIEKVTGEKPVLLLDDIFSELDHEHREVVMEVVKSRQTVITAADEHLVEGIEGKMIRL